MECRKVNVKQTLVNIRQTRLMLFSSAIDEGKREVRIISSVSYWNSSIVKKFPFAFRTSVVHKEFSV